MAAGKLASVRCLVVTPESTVLDADGSYVVIPAYDGEVGIAPGRAPLVARLGAGELRLTTGSETLRFHIEGGLSQVANNVVTVLTPRARKAGEIHSEQVEKQIAEALATVPTTDLGFDRKQARLDALRSQLRLARRKKSAADH